MVTSIKTRVDRIYNAIGKMQKDLIKLQDACTHPNVKKEHKSNTGNWDRGDDSYWINFDCPDCRKRWMEDQ